MSDSKVDRRAFVKTASSACVAASLVSVAAAGQQEQSKSEKPKSDSVAAEDISLDGRIYKTLKINMVKVEGSLTDKFTASKRQRYGINHALDSI